MTILPHGTTIEALEIKGHIEHRVCNKGGGMCRIARDEYQAKDFARLFEEYTSN